MRALLESWWQNPVPGLSLKFPEQSVPGALQFRLTSIDLEDWMDVSLVPAFDVLGEGFLDCSRVGGKITGNNTGLPILAQPPTCYVTWASLYPSLSLSLGTKHIGLVPDKGRESPVPPGSVVLLSRCLALPQASGSFPQPLPRAVTAQPFHKYSRKLSQVDMWLAVGAWGQNQISAKSCILS